MPILSQPSAKYYNSIFLGNNIIDASDRKEILSSNILASSHVGGRLVCLIQINDLAWKTHLLPRTATHAYHSSIAHQFHNSTQFCLESWQIMIFFSLKTTALLQHVLHRKSWPYIYDDGDYYIILFLIEILNVCASKRIRSLCCEFVDYIPLTFYLIYSYFHLCCF